MTKMWNHKQVPARARGRANGQDGGQHEHFKKEKADGELSLIPPHITAGSQGSIQPPRRALTEGSVSNPSRKSLRKKRQITKVVEVR